MNITFYGAARMVTGSCYLLEAGGKRLLIDCGLVQGSQFSEDVNYQPFPFDPTTIDTVLLTHTHLDHIGRVPKLVKEGFTGKIISTNATLSFAKIMLDDSMNVLSMEAEKENKEPLYTQEDVDRTAELFSGVDYHEVVELTSGVTAEFFDAGHILGSAMIRITENGKSIVFSGDLGNPPVPILKPTELITEADYVVMESTYGGREHEDKDTRTLLLKSLIYETVTMGGVLMIPAFAMERTQELLYEINTLVNDKEIPPVPIYLDSPLAIKATQVFKKHASYFNDEAQQSIKSGDDIFNFPGLKSTPTSEESKGINNAPAPKIIIAGSGMAQGGRILHHIKNYISNFANTYLIVGYQVQGSLGRRLLDGEKTVRVHGEEYQVKARVKAIGGYSAHADQPKLTSWVSSFDQKRLKKIFLTHGEEDQAEAFARHLHQELSAEVTIPNPDERIEL